VLLIIMGCFNVIDGLMGVADANYFRSVAAGHGIELPVTDSIVAWGWITLISGVLLFVAGFAVFRNATWARVVAFPIVLVNMIVQFGFLPALPFWSVLIILLDALVLYGLAIHVDTEE
jgi:hypothetical protein